MEPKVQVKCSKCLACLKVFKTEKLLLLKYSEDFLPIERMLTSDSLKSSSISRFIFFIIFYHKQGLNELIFFSSINKLPFKKTLLISYHYVRNTIEMWLFSIAKLHRLDCFLMFEKTFFGSLCIHKFLWGMRSIAW